MMTFTTNTLLTILLALAAMAFFTLLERKILGYSQTRKGPNKVSIQGLPQPISDALKLFSKSTNNPSSANYLPFILSPTMNLMLALILWVLMPSSNPTKFMTYGLIIFLCVSSMSVYTTIGSGWSSNSKYALLGTLRSIAQTISYEVTLALWMISLLIMLNSFNIQWLTNNSMFSIILTSPIMAYVWFICLLAETNRAPFDFAEGESELVSGFNTEYSSFMFAFIFMAEYLNIMFVSLISTILLLQKSLSPTMSILMIMTQSVLLMTMFIMTRTTMPRMRYDRLMNLTWMSLLPVSLMYIIIKTNVAHYWIITPHLLQLIFKEYLPM